MYWNSSATQPMGFYFQSMWIMWSPVFCRMLEEIMEPFQEGVHRPQWHTPSVTPCEDPQRLSNCTRSQLGAQGRLPGSLAA